MINEQRRARGQCGGKLGSKEERKKKQNRTTNTDEKRSFGVNRDIGAKPKIQKKIKKIKKKTYGEGENQTRWGKNKIAINRVGGKLWEGEINASVARALGS
jgi:hypothetical protein